VAEHGEVRAGAVPGFEVGECVNGFVGCAHRCARRET
jgi:hypothetical protein